MMMLTLFSPLPAAQLLETGHNCRCRRVVEAHELTTILQTMHLEQEVGPVSRAQSFMPAEAIYYR